MIRKKKTHYSNTKRIPNLLLRLSGVLLLRFAQRTLFGSLFQEPPRKTRKDPELPIRPRSAAKPCGFIAESALCSDRFTNASLSDSTKPQNPQTRAPGCARRKTPNRKNLESQNRRNRIRVTEDREPEARATATPASESQRNDSEEKNTLLQHQTNTELADTVDRSEVGAARTTNAVRLVVPGAAPQNAERPRVGP